MTNNKESNPYASPSYTVEEERESKELSRKWWRNIVGGALIIATGVLFPYGAAKWEEYQDRKFEESYRQVHPIDEPIDSLERLIRQHQE